MREPDDEYRPPGAQVNEAKGNYAEMAEALGEKIDDPAAGLVTRDYLDKRFAEFEARFTWKIVGLLGVQIVIFSLITKYL
jgi:hypothetical protein